MSSVCISFVLPDGSKKDIEAESGVSVLQVAQENGIDMEGACEGNMACSTCHVIVSDEFFDKLPEASEDEEEMLDLAIDLRPTSRLGCQLMVTEECDGISLTLPKASRNMMGF